MTPTLPIAATWDGIPVADRAAVQLVGADDGLLLRILAPLHGDPPPPGPPGPTDRLWEREVVELFVAGPGERYLEVEVGPHGHHLVLRLDGVRRPTETLLPMAVTTRRCEGRFWAGTARIPRAWLPAGPHRANAYRIHGPPSDRRYLAHAAVPGAAPDFHRLDRFVPVDLPSDAHPRVDAIAALVAAVADVPRSRAAAVVAARAAAGLDDDALALDALLRCLPPASPST